MKETGGGSQQRIPRGYGWQTTLSLVCPPSTADSTSLAVRQFWSYYTSPGHGDDSILKDQFNPFLRETIPPLLVEAYAEGHETWYGCVVTRAWTTVRVRLLDVAPYTVTLRVLDNGAVRRFSGIGDQWFVAEIDYWTECLTITESCD